MIQSRYHQYCSIIFEWIKPTRKQAIQRLKMKREIPFVDTNKFFQEQMIFDYSLIRFESANLVVLLLD